MIYFTNILLHCIILKGICVYGFNEGEREFTQKQTPFFSLTKKNNNKVNMGASNNYAPASA